jgi:cell division septation protein DedD
MAADKRVSAANRRRSRWSGWVLSQFQVVLALCGMIVGFLVCFGLGFLFGVWFQAQEQILPHGDAISLADDQLEREGPAASPGREMTFYSALASRDGTPALQPQLQAVAAPLSAPNPESQPPDPMPVVASQSAQPSRLDEAEPNDAKPDDEKPDAANQVLPAPLMAPAAPKSTPEVPAAVATAPGQPFYSVQVGSFRQVEQAHRLQDDLLKKGYQARIGLSIVAGKGTWYRVRVGRYTDRDAADETAQRLQEKEKIDVLVMQVSS